MLKYVAGAKGFAMVQHPGDYPFVTSEDHWRKLPFAYGQQAVEK